jgi:hypothetical protein
MMPPSGAARPEASDLEALIVWLENELDRNALSQLPPPGLHRLNRTEYTNVIRDLLGLEIAVCRVGRRDRGQRRIVKGFRPRTHVCDKVTTTQCGQFPALL